MTFLVALAMGTMYCVTVIQFIPEALGKTKMISLVEPCQLAPFVALARNNQLFKINT